MAAFLHLERRVCDRSRPTAAWSIGHLLLTFWLPNAPVQLAIMSDPLVRYSGDASRWFEFDVKLGA
jgi:hypothetical protein